MDDERLSTERLEAIIEDPYLVRLAENLSMATELLDLRERMRASARSRKMKVTDAQILEIRRRRTEGQTYRSIGDLYGISHVHVRNICLGNSRTYIDTDAVKSDS